MLILIFNMYVFINLICMIKINLHDFVNLINLFENFKNSKIKLKIYDNFND